jgi:hypothetical protein
MAFHAQSNAKSAKKPFFKPFFAANDIRLNRNRHQPPMPHRFLQA